MHCSGQVVVAAGMASGKYAAIDLRAWDALDNETLAVQLLPAITVTGGSSDTAGPTITNVTVSPTTVQAGQTISVSFDLNDPSGLGDQAGRAQWLLSGTGQSLSYRCFSAGHPTTMHCSGQVVVAAGMASGKYAAIDLRAWDALDNETLAVQLLPAITVTDNSAPTATPTPTATPALTFGLRVLEVSRDAP
jgi:hypothetical protein